MPRVWFKEGVSLRDLQPQTLWAMERVKDIWHARGLNCVFTSIWRPQAARRSLHPLGRAFDTDTDRELSPTIWGLISDEAQVILGDEYDVLAHDDGSGMHLHVEWDPDWAKPDTSVVTA